MCGFAAIIGGAGGVGKTTRAVASGLAVLTERHDITGEHVFQSGKVWFITLEDDRPELERRIAAGMLLHTIRREDVEGGLFVNDMSRSSARPLVFIETDETGNPKVTIDAERIIEQISRHDIRLTIIEPLIKAHRGIENRNEHMDALADTVNGIARITRQAVLLAAHFRKGSKSDGSADSFRGGGALIDSFRLTRALTSMTEDDGRAFNLPPATVKNIIREQNPKANMAPRQDAVWFELVDVPLGNTEVDPRYPAGDHVQALKPWTPPATFEGLSANVLAAIFTRLHREPAEGWRWSLSSRQKYPAFKAVMDEGGKSHEQAKAVIDAWANSKLLTETDYINPNRDKAAGVVLDEAKAAAILASLQGNNWEC
jgi:RecA-family ATPase